MEKVFLLKEKSRDIRAPFSGVTYHLGSIKKVLLKILGN